MTAGACHHCGHDWDRHQRRCDCGCMWTPPKPPPPPPPPPNPLVEAAKAAIFAELDRQHEHSEIDGAGYWDREWGSVDGEPDWDKVAAAAVEAVLDTFSPPDGRTNERRAHN